MKRKTAENRMAATPPIIKATLCALAVLGGTHTARMSKHVNGEEGCKLHHRRELASFDD